MAASSYYSAVQKAYIAFYGRPADPSGLTYWAGRIDAAGGNISSIITAFGNSAEATSLYGGVSNAVAVNTLYQQIFGRDADITGLNYYVGKLLDGSFTLVDIAQRIIDGASGDDATIVANKLTAAQSFTDAIDTAAELIGYSGNTAAESARDWLGTVTATASTVTSAQAAITATLNAMAEGGGGAATTTALTTSVDELTGGNGNDTYTAVSNTGSATWNNGDAIDGGAGVDTVSLMATGTDTAIVGLTNIETVSIRALSDSAFDAVDWSGVDTVTIASNSLTGADLTVNNADVASTYVLNGDHDLTANFVNASASTVNLVINSVGSGTADLTTVTMTTANAISTINIAASGTNYLSLNATAGASSVVITGAGSVYATATETTVTSINASAMTGALDIGFATGADVTVTGGAGNDTFRFGAAGGFRNEDTVDGGAGQDTLSATLSTQRVNLSNTQNVETANLTFGGVTGLVDASGTDVTTFNLRADTTGAFELRNADATTLTLQGTGTTTMTSVSADFTGGNLSLRAGSASAAATDFGAVTLSGVSALTVTVQGTASISQDIGTLTLVDAKTLNLTAGSASLALDALAGSALSTVSITTTGTGTITNAGNGLVQASSLSSLTVNASNGNVTLDGGNGVGTTNGIQNATITLNASNGADIAATTFAANASGTMAVSITATGSGTTVGNDTNGIDLTGLATTTGQTVISSLNINASGDANVYIGQISLGQTAVDAGIGNIDVTIGASADVAFVDYVTANTVGNLTVTLGNGSTFTQATAWEVETIGDITITGANVTLDEINSHSSMGDFTFTGSSLTVANLGANTGDIGDITIAAVTSAAITSITADSVGTITLSGSGDVTIGRIEASSVAGVDLTGVVGSSNTTISIDLRGVTSSVTVDFASATTTVYSGGGNDVFNLASAQGADTIAFTSTALAADTVYNFQVGTGGDAIALGSTGLNVLSYGTGLVNATIATATSYLELASGSYATTEFTGYAYVVISGTAYSNADEMINAIATGGAAALTIGGTANATAGNIAVVWTDGTDSYVTLVATTGVAGTGIIQGGATASDVTLATLYGVDRVDLESWAIGNINLENY